MEQLWAPWRMEYIRSDKSEKCIFCKGLKDGDDRGNLLLLRGRGSSIMLNRYPYNSGHLMVFPNRHVKDLSLLEGGESTEIIDMLNLSIDVLKKTMNPMGFNIGINMGKCAGAGIEDHLHIHVVPRWAGDTNFMPVIGDTKVISQHLMETYDSLYTALHG